MYFRTYKISLKSDSGIITISVNANTIADAVAKVLKSEVAPECSITKIKITNIN